MVKKAYVRLGPAMATTALLKGDAKTAARYLREGITDRYLSEAPLRDQAFLDLLADMLDPDSNEEAWRLELKPCRAGTKAGRQLTEFWHRFIAHECDALYRKYLQAGKAKRGLSKLVEGEVSDGYDIKETTVAQIWRAQKRAPTPRRRQRSTVSNALVDHMLRQGAHRKH